MPSRTDERLILELLKNHGEFRATLVSLSMNADLQVLESHVHSVARSWFELAREHYNEALRMDPAVIPRAVYSRAYYAAYNASKALRYVCRGHVSLKGDDHRKVSDLPDAFPDVEAWTSKLPVLYEHRLRADYDRWSQTAAENTRSPEECLKEAGEFIQICADFLLSNYGLTV